MIFLQGIKKNFWEYFLIQHTPTNPTFTAPTDITHTEIRTKVKIYLRLRFRFNSTKNHYESHYSPTMINWQRERGNVYETLCG